MCALKIYIHSSRLIVAMLAKYAMTLIESGLIERGYEGGAIPASDSVRDTEGSEGDVDEFKMLTTDMDASIERAVALPEYVMLEQDDILKATVFRFVYIQSSRFGRFAVRLRVTVA